MSERDLVPDEPHLGQLHLHLRNAGAIRVVRTSHPDRVPNGQQKIVWRKAARSTSIHTAPDQQHWHDRVED